MRFGSEVKYVRDLVFDDNSADGDEITQVHFLEDVFRVAINSFEIFEVAGITETIYVYDRANCWLINDVPDHV